MKSNEELLQEAAQLNTEAQINLAKASALVERHERQAALARETYETMKIRAKSANEALSSLARRLV